MAKHELRADRRRKAPKATIQAAPTVYEITKPAGSAEWFLDDAAKAALAAAAAGGLPSPKQFIPGAIRAVAKEAEKYPDPLLAEAAGLPREELLRRAATAEAYQKAMEAQNEVVRAASTALSPAGNMAANQAGAAAHDALTRQDAKGGDMRSDAKGGDAAGSETAVSEPSVSKAPMQQGGPRIVINPTTFRNSKDALCVAFNEAFRIIMEANGFNSVSEPTEKQREFFSDTAYADDEVMLRRTILARICTFDTSVSDPTDEQLQEALEFLNTVLEIGAPQNQWEQWAVRRVIAMLQKVVGLDAEEPAEPKGGPANADVGGGASAEDEELKRLQEGTSGVSVQDDTSTVEEREKYLAERGMDTSLAETGSMQQLQQMHEEQMRGGAEEPKPEEPAAAAQPVGQGGQPAEQPVNQGGQPPQPPTQGQVSATTTENPKEETTASRRNGVHSGVWTGGEPGKGRELTAREAEWLQQRAASGARISAQQKALVAQMSGNQAGEPPEAQRQAANEPPEDPLQKKRKKKFRV